MPIFKAPMLLSARSPFFVSPQMITISCRLRILKANQEILLTADQHGIDADKSPAQTHHHAGWNKTSRIRRLVQKNVTGDEKGQAQLFLDRLFQAFGQTGCLDVGGTTEFRIYKADEDGGGTAFAD